MAATPSPPTTAEVAVVGAGMAGLGAARMLADAGVDVVMLEARDRLGGRTHTIEVAGRSVDAGAAWIHGLDGNPMTPLAEAAGVTLRRTWWHHPDRPSIVADPDGRRLDHRRFASGFGRFWERLDAAFDDGAAPAMTVSDALGPGRPLDPDPLTGDERAGFVYGAEIAVAEVEAADPDALTLGERLPEDRPGGDHLLLEGYGRIVDHLAAGLTVHTGCPVERVRAAGAAVEVAGGFGSIRADHVVLTCPLGVLRSGTIDLGELLPDGVRTRLDRIGVGAAEKLVLAFDDPHWPDEVRSIARLDTDPLDPFPSWIAHPNGPTLVSYAAGRRARAMAERSTEELVTEAIAGLRIVLGDLPEPIDVARTAWTADPWSRGAYSFDGRPGAHTARRAIAEWQGEQLHLAGEAWWPDHHATADGALSSGRAVAARLLR